MPKRRTLEMFFPYFAYSVLVKASKMAKVARPRMSPTVFGIPSAVSRKTDTQFVIEISAAPPKKMQKKHSIIPALLYVFPFSAFSCERFIWGMGDVQKRYQFIKGRKA